MATKPTNNAEWGTGAAPIVEPTLPQKQAGWSPSFKPPAQWFNWFFNLVHLWIVWLDAFESEVHTWTAAQTFSAKVISNFASSTQPAVLGFNTNAGAGVGVRGDSANGIGVDGVGLVRGVSGTQTGVFPGGAGVFGNATDVDAFGAIFEHLFGGVAAKINTQGSSSPNTALQVFASGYGIEVTAQGNVGIDVNTTKSAVGTSSVRTRGGRSGVLGRPAAGVTSGVGVEGIGETSGPGLKGTGGATSGDGVTGTGGAPNGAGARFTGTGTGQGVVAVGNVGGEFGRTDADPTLPAIVSVGAIQLAGASDRLGNVAILNELHRKLTVKAWALVQLNNTPSPVILDRMNVAAVTQDANGVNFTFAQGFASTTYGVFGFITESPDERHARSSRTSATVARVQVRDATNTTLGLIASNGLEVLMVAIGAQ